MKKRIIIITTGLLLTTIILVVFLVLMFTSNTEDIKWQKGIYILPTSQYLAISKHEKEVITQIQFVLIDEEVETLDSFLNTNRIFLSNSLGNRLELFHSNTLDFNAYFISGLKTIIQKDGKEIISETDDYKHYLLSFIIVFDQRQNTTYDRFVFIGENEINYIIGEIYIDFITEDSLFDSYPSSLEINNILDNKVYIPLSLENSFDKTVTVHQVSFMFPISYVISSYNIIDYNYIDGMVLADTELEIDPDTSGTAFFYQRVMPSPTNYVIKYKYKYTYDGVDYVSGRDLPLFYCSEYNDITYKYISNNFNSII